MRGRLAAALLAATPAALAAAFAGCGGSPALERPDPSTPALLTGEVTYRARVALPPDAVVEVRLEDVSRADAPAETIAEVQVPTEGRQVPIPFALAYDPARIVSSDRYAVRAAIRAGGRMSFATTTSHSVLTGGASVDDVTIVVELVPDREAADREAAAAPEPWSTPVTYEGARVAGDGTGFRITLTLFDDGTFRQRWTPLDPAGGEGAPHHDLGRWTIEGTIRRLVLRGGREAPEFYDFVDGHRRIVRLDAEGRTVDPATGYALARQPDVDPIAE